MDLRQSPKYAKFMLKRGWIVEKIPPLKSVSGKDGDYVFAYIRKLPLLPLSVMKIQRFDHLIDFKQVESVARKHGVFSITLEPATNPKLSRSQLDQIMNKYGYRKGRGPFLPTKTLQVDLNKSNQKILANMKKDARASIRKAKLKCNAEIIDADDLECIDRFYSFWKKYGKGYIPSYAELSLLLKTFKKDVFIVISSKQDQFLAGAVILLSRDRAYYYYAVTSPAGRKLFAGYLAVWEAMLEAKRRKCSIFDYEGIIDERFPQLKRWKGFSKFKEKFGGKEKIYPEPYIRYLLPFS